MQEQPRPPARSPTGGEAVATRAFIANPIREAVQALPLRFSTWDLMAEDLRLSHRRGPGERAAQLRTRSAPHRRHSHRFPAPRLRAPGGFVEVHGRHGQPKTCSSSPRRAARSSSKTREDCIRAPASGARRGWCCAAPVQQQPVRDELIPPARISTVRDPALGPIASASRRRNDRAIRGCGPSSVPSIAEPLTCGAHAGGASPTAPFRLHRSNGRPRRHRARAQRPRGSWRSVVAGVVSGLRLHQGGRLAGHGLRDLHRRNRRDRQPDLASASNRVCSAT